MKKLDKVYLYSDGSMCPKIYRDDKNTMNVDAFVIKENLKITGSYIDDDGIFFTLRDSKNRVYYMLQNDFNKYIEKHNIILDSEFEFVTDGKTQSIREFGERNGWISLREKQPELELCMTKKEFYAISKPLKIRTYVGCEFIARYKITLAAYDLPIGRNIFIIYGLNEDATLDYDKVQYWKEIEE